MKRIVLPAVVGLIAAFSLACGGDDAEPEVVVIPVPEEVKPIEKAPEPKPEVAPEVEAEADGEAEEVKPAPKTIEERKAALGDGSGGVKSGSTGTQSAAKKGSGSSTTSGTTSKKTSGGSSSGGNTSGTAAKKK